VSVRQLTELRHPAPVPSVCRDGNCLGGGSGGGSVADGAPDPRDPHALSVSLLRIAPTDIKTSEPFEVEFRVLNAGKAPISLPVSPHLSELQPEDASADFAYLSLALVVRAECELPEGKVMALGFGEIYG